MKRKILLCWWYDRKDLMAPLLELQSDFDATCLFYRFKEQEKLSPGFPYKRIYWTDYGSPYDILREQKPDEVLFMGIENLLTIGLLVAAKQSRIKTTYLSHGITFPYKLMRETEINVEAELVDERYQQHNVFYQKKKRHSLTFYFRALRASNLDILPFMLRFLVNTRRFASIHERLYETPSLYRLASRYVVFSKKLVRHLQDRDRVPDDRYCEIGLYNMDAIFTRMAQVAPTIKAESYWVLIDQPLVHYSFDDKKNFYTKLSRAASSKGKQLVIKLHPMDYDRDDLPMLGNVSYVKECADITVLILKSEGCLGFYSTLLIPALNYKKSILFKTGRDIFLDEWQQMGLIMAFHFKEFDAEMIDFDSFDVSESSKERYVQEYLRYNDGRSLFRLKELLYQS